MLKSLSQWAKANIRIVPKVSETNEVEFLSQWAKANVGIVFKVSKTIEVGLFYL